MATLNFTVAYSTTLEGVKGLEPSSRSSSLIKYTLKGNIYVSISQSNRMPETAEKTMWQQCAQSVIQ